MAPSGALVLSLAVLLMAGCASGPAPVGGKSSTVRSGGVPVPPRSADRDGAPSDAPPDLASLPDAVPQVEPIKPGGPNKPYVVLGQAYAPTVGDIKWTERGTASWYGTKFHGRRTASGEMFSMYGFTAAHRTLPIPSYARVRHVGSGKEIIVRVNDRGPFHSSRVIDLSYAAAAKLGITSAGMAQVDIERLTFDEIRSGAWQRNTDLAAEPALAAADPVQVADATPVVSTAVPAVAIKEGSSRAYTPNAKGFWVQLAALGRRDGVDRLQQRVATEAAPLSPLLAVFHEAPYFKLQVGPYGSRDEAMTAAQQAREALQLTPLVIERR